MEKDPPIYRVLWKRNVTAQSSRPRKIPAVSYQRHGMFASTVPLFGYVSGWFEAYRRVGVNHARSGPNVSTVRCVARTKLKSPMPCAATALLPCRPALSSNPEAAGAVQQRLGSRGLPIGHGFAGSRQRPPPAKQFSDARF
jgi:hypothetical protein